MISFPKLSDLELEDISDEEISGEIYNLNIFANDKNNKNK